MKKYPYGLTLRAVCEAIDAYRDHEDDVPEAGIVAAFEILLAAMDKPETALTAQPVKLPKSERLDGNGYGYYFDMNDVFVALDASGIKYEVQPS